MQQSEALAFLLHNREALFPGVPVVFFDVVRSEFERLRPPADVTGSFLVLRRRQRTVDVAFELVPGARLVVIVSGASASDRRNAAFALRLVKARAPQLEVLSAGRNALRRAAAAPGRAAGRQRGDLRQLPRGRPWAVDGRPPMSLRLVARASNAPTFGAAEVWLGRGIVGGDLIRYGVQAQRAAGLAARLLKGEPIASIPSGCRADRAR